MILVRFNEPQEFHSSGQDIIRVRVFIDEEKIGRKDITVGMSIYGAGMDAPFHTHNGSEAIIMVHGKGKFGTREKAFEAEAGDPLSFVPGEEHFLRNIGSQTLEFVFIYSPPRDEQPIKEKWVLLAK